MILQATRFKIVSSGIRTLLLASCTTPPMISSPTELWARHPHSWAHQGGVDYRAQDGGRVLPAGVISQGPSSLLPVPHSFSVVFALHPRTIGGILAAFAEHLICTWGKAQRWGKHCLQGVCSLGKIQDRPRNDHEAKWSVRDPTRGMDRNHREITCGRGIEKPQKVTSCPFSEITFFLAWIGFLSL